MPIAPLPSYGTPPNTSDPDNFDARADAKVAADVVFVEQMNADTIPGINAAVGSVNAAMAAGLANAATNAATAATKAGEAATSAGSALTYRNAAQGFRDEAEYWAGVAEDAGALPPVAGQGGKFLRVKADESGKEWAAAGVRMVTEYLPPGTTWNAPANLIGGRVKYRLQGPGGGGGWTASVAFGSGGGPGGYCEGIAAATAGSPYTYAIGAGGAVASGSAGSAGGSTTMFGATAGGGGGGPSGASTVPAQLGGSASGADYNQPGPNTASASGNPLLIVPSGTVRFGAYGGATGTGAGTTFDSTGYGVGGRPGNQSNSGQAGRPGLIILEYLVSI